MDDIELIKCVKQGDREAFKALVDIYKDMVYKICYGFVKNKEDTEDITQDVFFTIFKNIKNFKYESKISTWIYRIAVNRSLNHIRKRKLSGIFTKRNILYVDSENAAEIPAPEDSSAEHTAVTGEKKKVIFKALNGLPSNQRVAFTLCHVEGLTYEKIAGIMGCSVSAVESRIHRAKINLQKKLVDYLKEFS
ncbi:hypothetical protein AMJ80_02160 [bacterium SM23_31]|nr:MAG: hypothetical protein AMJ80_02160 [bacterium SM23_31]